MNTDKQTTTAKRLSPQALKAIIISAICIVVVAVIVVSLVIVLQPQKEKTIDPADNESKGSSTLTIKNGDFEYVAEDATLFPKEADNWTKYGYKASSGSSKGFKTITTDSNIVMGVVDTSSDNWATVTSDLKAQGVTLNSNPGVPATAKDSNVYMIYNKQDANASIYSQSFTLSSLTSAKITIRLKGEFTGKAFVMIKYNDSSAASSLEVTTNGTQQWYAYNFNLDSEALSKDVDENGWHEEVLYVFNQASSGKSLYCNVGLGDVYGGNADAKGVLFIDDIKYETVTANVYREQYSNLNSQTEGKQTCYAIEKAANTNVTETISFADISEQSGAFKSNLKTATFYQESAAIVDGKAYSPFVDYGDEDKNYTIYSLTNSTKSNKSLVAESSTVTIAGPSIGERLHFSMWIRVASDDILANANIYLMTGDEELASFKNVVTNKDIVKDDNCGWAQYHFYVKPAETAIDLKMVVSFGNRDGYMEGEKVIANGSIYFTQPIVEHISVDEYNNASGGAYSTKVDLLGSTASLGIANGSFSSTITNSTLKDVDVQDGAYLFIPQNWTPAFAGDNIFKNGEHNVTVAHGANDVQYGVRLGDSAIAPKFSVGGNSYVYDDEAQGVLKINNRTATSFGLISNSISVAANKTVVISVLAKCEGSAVPYIYLIEDKSNETDAVFASIKGSTSASSVDADAALNQVNVENGWVRYYFVVTTGDYAKTLKLALFNGDIEGKSTQQGVIYFDQATLTSIGSYTRDVEGSKELKDLTITATDGYSTIKELEEDGILDNEVVENIDLKLDEKEIIPASEEEEDDDDDDDEPDTPSTVDAALIVSIISSALLVGALLIVVVIKLFKRK